MADGYSPQVVLEKREKIRGFMFYPNGRAFSEGTYAGYLTQIAYFGRRQSVPYRRILTAVRNYDLFLDSNSSFFSFFKGIQDYSVLFAEVGINHNRRDLFTGTNHQETCCIRLMNVIDQYNFDIGYHERFQLSVTWFECCDMAWMATLTSCSILEKTER